MEIDKIAMSLQNSVLTYPFDETTRVYKVENKMFMLSDDSFKSVSVKNDPAKNYLLRENYEYIKEGYHLNKEHWITIDLEGEYDPKLVESLIIESYVLILSKLPKKDRVKYMSILSEYQSKN